MTTYRWKAKARAAVEPQTVGECLERVRVASNGHLTTAAVVRDAKPKRSPLHPCFEWDDKAAAQNYREEQARYLIRSVVVVMNEDTDHEKEVRAFVSVDAEESTHYTSLAVAMSDAELRQQVLQRAWRELESWQDRYSDYEELAGVFSAIDAEKDKAA